jgi:hypothetical protein
MMNFCSEMMSLTRSPMEIMPTSLPFSTTGRWRRRLVGHELHALLAGLGGAHEQHVGGHHVAHLRGGEDGDRAPQQGDLAGVVALGEDAGRDLRGGSRCRTNDYS